MIRTWLLAAGLALAACTPDAPPATAKPPQAMTGSPAMAPPAQPAATPAAEPLTKEIMELPSKPAAKPAPPPEAAPRPATRKVQAANPDEIFLPSFTFRAIDHQQAEVLLNGEELSTTPCLWAISESIAFDPKIPVAEWPPPGAKFIGSTQSADAPSSKAELYLMDDRSLLSKLPHVQPDECVLYVKGSVGSKGLLGALRLHVEGYRYTVYAPLVDPEGELASKFLRTLWFERKRRE